VARIIDKEAVPLFSRLIVAGSGARANGCGDTRSGARTGIHDCAAAGPLVAMAESPPSKIKYRSITGHCLSRQRCWRQYDNLQNTGSSHIFGACLWRMS